MWESASDSIAPTARHFIAHSLTPSTTYQVRIRAKNRNGSGPWSAKSANFETRAKGDPHSVVIPSHVLAAQGERDKLDVAGGGRLDFGELGSAEQGSGLDQFAEENPAVALSRCIWEDSLPEFVRAMAREDIAQDEDNEALPALQQVLQRLLLSRSRLRQAVQAKNVSSDDTGGASDPEAWTPASMFDSAKGEAAAVIVPVWQQELLGMASAAAMRGAVRSLRWLVGDEGSAGSGSDGGDDLLGFGDASVHPSAGLVEASAVIQALWSAALAEVSGSTTAGVIQSGKAGTVLHALLRTMATAQLMSDDTAGEDTPITEAQLRHSLVSAGRSAASALRVSLVPQALAGAALAQTVLHDEETAWLRGAAAGEDGGTVAVIALELLLPHAVQGVTSATAIPSGHDTSAPEAGGQPADPVFQRFIRLVTDVLGFEAAFLPSASRSSPVAPSSSLRWLQLAASASLQGLLASHGLSTTTPQASRVHMVITSLVKHISEAAMLPRDKAVRRERMQSLLDMAIADAVVGQGPLVSLARVCARSLIRVGVAGAFIESTLTALLDAQVLLSGISPSLGAAWPLQLLAAPIADQATAQALPADPWTDSAEADSASTRLLDIMTMTLQPERTDKLLLRLVQSIVEGVEGAGGANSGSSTPISNGGSSASAVSDGQTRGEAVWRYVFRRWSGIRARRLGWSTVRLSRWGGSESLMSAGEDRKLSVGYEDGEVEAYLVPRDDVLVTFAPFTVDQPVVRMSMTSEASGDDTHDGSGIRRVEADGNSKTMVRRQKSVWSRALMQAWGLLLRPHGPHSSQSIAPHSDEDDATFVGVEVSRSMDASAEGAVDVEQWLVCDSAKCAQAKQTAIVAHLDMGAGGIDASRAPGAAGGQGILCSMEGLTQPKVDAGVHADVQYVVRV